MVVSCLTAGQETRGGDVESHHLCMETSSLTAYLNGMAWAWTSTSNSLFAHMRVYLQGHVTTKGDAGLYYGHCCHGYTVPPLASLPLSSAVLPSKPLLLHLSAP